MLPGGEHIGSRRALVAVAREHMGMDGRDKDRKQREKTGAESKERGEWETHRPAAES